MYLEVTGGKFRLSHIARNSYLNGGTVVNLMRMFGKNSCITRIEIQKKKKSFVLSVKTRDDSNILAKESQPLGKV